MATANQTFVLVQMVDNDITRPRIQRIVRTFLSEQRAEQDRELLADTNPNGFFCVLIIDHIDD